MRDAQDFWMLCRHYGFTEAQEQLYEEDYAQLETFGHDLEKAGWWLMGRDVSRICQSRTAELLGKLFRDDSLRTQLHDHIVKTIHAEFTGEGDRAQQMLELFAEGLSAES